MRGRLALPVPSGIPTTLCAAGAIRESPFRWRIGRRSSLAGYPLRHWYESMSRTPIRDRPLRRPVVRDSRHPIVNPAPNSSFRRRPESRGAGRGECSAGACPPLGSGRGPGAIRRDLHSSPSPGNQCSVVEDYARRGACPPLGRRRGVAEPIVPIRRTKSQLALFPILVCRRQPAQAIAMKTCPGSRSEIDSRHSSRHWYENALKRLSSAPATPPFVIPAKAGIHALTSRERTSTAIPLPTSTRRPHFVFPAKAHPDPRYGAGIQRGVGGANFHTLVCRRQPAQAIAMKTCP